MSLSWSIIHGVSRTSAGSPPRQIVACAGESLCLERTSRKHQSPTIMTGISLLFLFKFVAIIDKRPFSAKDQIDHQLIGDATLFKQNFEDSQLRVVNLLKRHIDKSPRQTRVPLMNYLRGKGTFADLEMLVTDRPRLAQRIELVALDGIKKRDEACMAEDSTSRKKPLSEEVKTACEEYAGNVNQEGNTLGGSKLKSSKF